jgi:hypothetical protein
VYSNTEITNIYIHIYYSYNEGIKLIV